MFNIKMTVETASYFQALLIERPIKEAGAVHADFVRQCLAEQKRLDDEVRATILAEAKI